MSVIASLNAEIRMHQANHKELESMNQVLKDEYQALQLAFTKLEEKLRKSQVVYVMCIFSSLLHQLFLLRNPYFFVSLNKYQIVFSVLLL